MFQTTVLLLVAAAVGNRDLPFDSTSSFSRSRFPKVTHLQVRGETMAQRDALWVDVRNELLFVMQRSSLRAFELSTGRERWKTSESLEFFNILGVPVKTKPQLIVDDWYNESWWTIDLTTGKARRLASSEKRKMKNQLPWIELECPSDMMKKYETSIIGRALLADARLNREGTCYFAPRTVQVPDDFQAALRDSDALCGPAVQRGDRFDVVLCHGEVLRFGGGMPTERRGQPIEHFRVMMNPTGVVHQYVEKAIRYFDESGKPLFLLPTVQESGEKPGSSSP